MFGKSFRLVLGVAACTCCIACSRQLTATDAQMAHMAETRNAPRAYLSYMVDNAIAQDMSIADIHFVGHTSELSGTGVARLERMACLLDTYGGTVRYATSLSNDELIAQRIVHVREYLALVGCDMERVEVAPMISGGRGMPATKAIEIDDRGVNPVEGGGGAEELGTLMGS